MPYGNDGTLALNFQNSYGTAQVTSLYFLPINDEDISLKIEELVSGEMRGNFDEGGSYAGKKNVSGTLNFDADMENLGVVFRAVMGPADTLTTSGAVNTHNWFPRTSDFDKYASSDPMTILVDLSDGGSAQQFYDCVATGFEIGVAAGELYKLNMTVDGGKFSQIAPVAASYSVESKMPWSVSSVYLTLTGSLHALTDLLDFNIKMSENAEARHVIAPTKYPSYVKRTAARTIEVSGTMLFNDQYEYQEFIKQSERQLWIKLHTGFEIQSGYQESVNIFAPAFRYTTFEPVLSGPTQIEVGFTGKCKYHAVGYSFEVWLVNTHAAY